MLWFNDHERECGQKIVNSWIDPLKCDAQKRIWETSKQTY